MLNPGALTLSVPSGFLREDTGCNFIYFSTR